MAIDVFRIVRRPGTLNERIPTLSASTRERNDCAGTDAPVGTRSRAHPALPDPRNVIWRPRADILQGRNASPHATRAIPHGRNPAPRPISVIPHGRNETMQATRAQMRGRDRTRMARRCRKEAASFLQPSSRKSKSRVTRQIERVVIIRPRMGQQIKRTPRWILLASLLLCCLVVGAVGAIVSHREAEDARREGAAWSTILNGMVGFVGTEEDFRSMNALPREQKYASDWVLCPGATVPGDQQSLFLAWSIQGAVSEQLAGIPHRTGRTVTYWAYGLGESVTSPGVHSAGFKSTAAQPHSNAGA